jgi:pimeloyl-ACP methyl ester carboxylesterase
VAHDWGSVLGTMLVAKYPELVDNFIQLDVAFSIAPKKIKDIPKILIMGAVYQYWMAIAFIIQALGPKPYAERLGDWLTAQALTGLGDRPTYTPDVCSAANYFYFYFHVNFWQELLGFRPAYAARNGVTETKHKPTLFVYAADKAFMFHDKAYVTELKGRGNGSRVVPLGERKKGEKPKVGHWIQHSVPEKLNDEITIWLSNNSGAADGGEAAAESK